jgi:hypothetical protein
MGGKGIWLRQCRLDLYVSCCLFNCFRRLTMSFFVVVAGNRFPFLPNDGGKSDQDVKNFALLIYFP